VGQSANTGQARGSRELPFCWGTENVDAGSRRRRRRKKTRNKRRRRTK
jgi:hypothetical protein